MEVDPKNLRLRAAELGSRLKGTNIYFVGMMGTGKSAVGRNLADVIGRYGFIDTDEVIEQLLGCPVHQVFAEDGEEAFRSVEAQVLDQVHSFVKLVIATGGGVVMRQQNWSKLHTGLVVWLDVPVDDVVARLSKDPEQVRRRPLLSGADPRAALEALLEQRRHMYEAADVRVVISAREDVQDVVLKVVEHLHDYVDSNPPRHQAWKEEAKTAGADWLQ
ncbi:unnamed protein product [Phaeothamnion confervicola]